MTARGRIRREQEQAVIDLPDRRLDYLIKRSSARRSLALRVNAQGQAQVNAPITMPQERIEAFLRRHADWLRNQMSRVGAGFTWSHGAELPYLGNRLSLDVVADRAWPHVRLESSRLLCPAGDLQTAVLAWYRSQARQLLGEALVAVCRREGRAVPVWRLSNARTRWGSLSAKGVVGLNWRLIKASRMEIDYVICHELAHFRQRNHAPAFWREVARLCPDYQTARLCLRTHGPEYLRF